MQRFTVIGYFAHNGQTVCRHVQATEGLHAFAEVAQQNPGLTLVVALPGHLTEAAGELTFPGEGVVEAETILAQPEVFGQASPSCAKCGSHLDWGYCSDQTCPYSDWLQSVPLVDMETMSWLELAQAYGAAKRLRVGAEVHDDGHHYEVDFDAAPWFAQASDQDIRALHEIGWEGDYASDAVAEFFEATHPDIAEVFTFCRATQRTRSAVGFECSVEGDEAMTWLKYHRPGLWACLVCYDESVSLLDVGGGASWLWSDARGNTSTVSFATQEDAARNAIEVLELNS